MGSVLFCTLLSVHSLTGGQEQLNSGTTSDIKPPVVRIAVSRAADLQERSLSGQYHFYLGTLHSHSGYSGDHARTIANRFNQGLADYSIQQPAEIFSKASTNFYDFYCVTDHSSPEQNEFYHQGFTDAHWAATRQHALASTTPRFVALRGYEFSRNIDPDDGGLGHMNVIGSPDWNSAYAPGHSFAWLYDHMTAQSNTLVVAQFNHPQMPGRVKVKNFNNYSGRTKLRNEAVRLAEIWNSGEKLNYIPVVQKIWAAGWKVAPTAGTDVHGLAGIDKRRLRTGVLAEQLTSEAILRALKERRVYATLEPLLHLDFTLNGFQMGTALKSRPSDDLKLRVFANDPGGTVLSRIEVYGGKYSEHGGAFQELTSIPLGRGRKLAESVIPSGHDFYYVAVFKDGLETPRAFTAPIWMDDD